MKKVDDYRPENIEFTAKTKDVPASLGKFKTADQARVFMAEYLLTVQSKHTAVRKMDHVEIGNLREQYREELEDVLPEKRADYEKKSQELETAKKNKKDAEEMVSASLNLIQQIADEVNAGVTVINLDAEFTWETIYNGKKYIYTYIDKEMKLAAVVDIPSYEANDLISSSEKNAKFFEGLKKAAND